jgi:predicted DNA binding CopG/RHH family protein
MERAMKTNKLPRTDSIQELARFWETHDLTDFEDELEEVTKPVFAGGDSIRLHLHSRDAEAIRRLAESKGVSQAELIRQWVSQKLGRRKPGGQARS